MGTEKKFYGLVIPKKHEKVQPTRKSIFDSDSDDDGPPIPVRKPSDPPKSAKAKIVEQKLLNDDPSIYEYDNIYDSLKEKSSQKVTEAKKKEPRFIQSLLKAAEKRKKDQDRRLEKKIQIERVKEGDEFKDKEAFVTSAYKQKMEEMEKDEERERIQNQLDEMMDVTKQNDLSGFYRHYLKQRIGEEKVPEFGENDPTLLAGVTIKTEPVESTSSSSKQKDNREEKQEKKPSKNIRRRSSSSSDDSHDEKPRNRPLESSRYKSRNSRKHDESTQASKHTRYDTSSDDDDNPSRKQSKKQKSVSPNHHSYEKLVGGKHGSKHTKLNTSSDDNKYDDRSKRHSSSPHGHSSRANQSGDKHSHSRKESKQTRHMSNDKEGIVDCSRKRPASSQGQSDAKHSERKYEHSKHARHDIASDEKEHKAAEKTSSLPNYDSHTEPKALNSKEANEDADDDDIVGSANEDADDSDIVESEKEDADDGDIVKSDAEPTRNDKKEKNSDMSVKFRKRTVGEVFDQAQARYFKRMAARGT